MANDKARLARPARASRQEGRRVKRGGRRRFVDARSGAPGVTVRGSRAEMIDTHLTHGLAALVEPEPTNIRAPTAKPSFEGRSAQLELQVASH